MCLNIVLIKKAYFKLLEVPISGDGFEHIGYSLYITSL